MVVIDCPATVGCVGVLLLLLTALAELCDVDGCVSEFAYHAPTPITAAAITTYTTSKTPFFIMPV
jgi:hypothetical protein